MKNRRKPVRLPVRLLGFRYDIKSVIHKKINKLDVSKIKTFFALWKTLLRELKKKKKKKPQTGNKYLQIKYLTKDLHPEYIKKLSKLKNKKTYNPIFLMDKNVNRCFTKEDLWMENTDTKSQPTSLVIREMQRKTTIG